MGLFTRDIKTMNDLFIHQLQDIYYAEKQLVKALPKMAEKATDKLLKQGFLTHLDETRTHVERLEEIFRMHGAEVKAVDCPAIDGIIEEADDVAGEVADKAVLDAALINAAQAAEHYEISRYGSLIAWARQLGRNDCASILQKTLDEEKTADKKLTSLAEGRVNLRRGADHGPRDLRIASDSIETYSPALGRDLEDLAIADLGDCELGPGSPRAQLGRAREEVASFWRPGLLPVMLGGDHTATLPVIEVLAPAIPELRILQLDAHPDLREEFLGERFNYASAMARVMDVVAPERVYQVGMRTG